jgi:Skp family chaperone for outer membrane proteins
MTYPAVNSDQVAALFAERQRYESWLSTLESKRAATPPHIYHRVHADYTARLQRVIEQLATHRAALQALEGTLADRLTSLDIDEAKHRDEAAEAELRAAVGELSAEQHREVMERTEAALSAVIRERAKLVEELAQLRAILEAGGIAPAQPRSAAGEGRAEPGSKSEGDWDLSFEKTPESKAPAAAGGPSPRRPSAEGRDDSSHVTGPFDDLEFLKSMVDSRSSGESVAVGSGAGGGDIARAAAGGGMDSATGGRSFDPARPQAGAPSTSVQHVEEIVLSAKEAPAEQVKTLKCQECGTLNYPTEWYCERCGAELAAL